MSYANIADMQAAFGDTELIQVTDRAGDGSMDLVILQGALDDASAEADSYLPTPANTPNRALVMHVSAIARYLLYQTKATDEVYERYKHAIAWLTKAATGKVTYDLSPLSAGTTASPAISPLMLPHEAMQVPKRGRYLF
ncbi:MAG: DUF1320 family protein [Mariprofundaceae bacterium]|nr:DUF1320 family protein [Mariprofundaceae bacterium]